MIADAAGLGRRKFLAHTFAAATAAIAAPRIGRAASKTYKACIIGSTGKGDYGHGMQLVFKHRKDVAVVGLADPDAEGRVKRAAESGAERTYADYREMLAKERPDLVSIGPRWTTEHPAMIAAAAEAGAHVYIEKPIAANLAEADAMVAALSKKNLKCAVAHQMRMAPMFHDLKKRLEAGEIGEVLEMRGRGKEDRRAGGEDLMVLGIHVMDLMRWFAGADPALCAARITIDGRPITKADARAATEPIGPIAGDTVHASYYFSNGITGTFASRKNRDGDGGRFGMTIHGSKGMAQIKFGGDGLEVRMLKDSSWRGGEGAGNWEKLPEPGGGDPVRGPDALNALAIDDLIAAIEANREPLLSIQSARAALEMTLAPYAAALSGGQIEMPLKDRAHPLGELAS